MQIVKFTASNRIIHAVDDTVYGAQTAVAGQTVRTLSGGEVTTYNTLLGGSPTAIIDDPSGGLRVETSGEFLARQPLAVRLQAAFETAMPADADQALLQGAVAAVVDAVTFKQWGLARYIVNNTPAPGGLTTSGAAAYPGLVTALLGILPS
jgi:hypothetical protein